MIKDFLTLGLLLSLLLCAACATQPEPAGELELVAELDQAPGNIAVTPDGRLILSQHPIFRPDIKVVELLPDGRDPSSYANVGWLFGLHDRAWTECLSATSLTAEPAPLSPRQPNDRAGPVAGW